MLGMNDRSAELAGMADGAEQVGRVVAVVAHHRRTRTDRGPDVFQTAFPADPRLVLKPDLERLAGSRFRQCLNYQASKVFLKASCAPIPALASCTSVWRRPYPAA